MLNWQLTFLCENLAFSDESELHCMSGEEKFTKPQEETVLINSVYAETGISARYNHMHYGTVSTCARLATERLDTLTVIQSFIGLANIFCVQTRHRSNKITGLQGTAKPTFDISKPLRVIPITLFLEKQQKTAWLYWCWLLIKSNFINGWVLGWKRSFRRTWGCCLCDMWQCRKTQV